MENITHLTNLRSINLALSIDADGNVTNVSTSDFIDKQNEMDKRIEILEAQVGMLENQLKDINIQKINDIKKDVKNKVMTKRKNESYISVSELRKRLGIGEHTAYKLLNDGEIFAFRIGSTYKIPESSIGEYIKNNSNRT